MVSISSYLIMNIPDFELIDWNIQMNSLIDEDKSKTVDSSFSYAVQLCSMKLNMKSTFADVLFLKDIILRVRF